MQHSVTTETGDAEGTPVAIIEASAAGLPVVSTLHGGIVDTVKNGDTGFLVEENDVSEMASKMLELLENPQMMKNFGDNAKKFTQENFSMQQHVEKVTEAILLAMRL